MAPVQILEPAFGHKIALIRTLLYNSKLFAETLVPMQLKRVFKASHHVGCFLSLKKKSKFSHLLLKSHNLPVESYIILALSLYLLLAEAIFNTLLFCACRSY